MDVHERPFSSPVPQRSRALEWPNYTSTTSIVGSGSRQKSFRTETPASPLISDAHWRRKLGPNKTYQPHSTLKLMDCRNERTNGWSNTCALSRTLNKETGVDGSPWPPQYTTTTSMPLWVRRRAKFYWGIDPLSIPTRKQKRTIKR